MQLAMCNVPLAMRSRRCRKGRDRKRYGSRDNGGEKRSGKGERGKGEKRRRKDGKKRGREGKKGRREGRKRGGERGKERFSIYFTEKVGRKKIK